MKTKIRLIAAAVIILGTLSGCARTVALNPAENASDTECADVVVRLPETVSDLPIKETNAQGTGAWGADTSAVLLRCGVPVPDPTSTLPCVLVDEVYWLRDDADAPNYVFTTYGRDPAVEVIVDQETVSPGAALYDLANAVSFTTETGACTDIEDSLG
ncbi:MAG: hypothetical protein JWM51_2053 [Microbacteriaceae bacterium]|jgi:hypothetical protein|nr:hypothetical protein [Microbacteriaceae bacterium]